MLYTVSTLMFSHTTTVVYFFKWPFTYRAVAPIAHIHIIIHIHIITKNPTSKYHIASSMWGGPRIISFIVYNILS